MPDVVAKIVNDDGTEQAFGPVSVSKKLAGQVAELLEPAEAKRQKDREAARVDEVRAEQETRSRQADEHNTRRSERAARGLDPDDVGGQ